MYVKTFCIFFSLRQNIHSLQYCMYVVLVINLKPLQKNRNAITKYFCVSEQEHSISFYCPIASISAIFTTILRAPIGVTQFAKSIVFEDKNIL